MLTIHYILFVNKLNIIQAPASNVRPHHIIFAPLMAHGILLRNGTEAHHPTLLRLWEASVRATHHFLQEDDIVFFRNSITEHRAFHHVSILCAVDHQDEITGFIGTSGNIIEMLFIHPAHIGKGIGGILLQHAIHTLGCTRVDVNEQNTQALHFYQHHGFTIASRSPLDGTGKPFPILHLAKL